VPDDRAVGGMLGPNMTVDVFVTATVNVPQDLIAAGKYYTDQSTKITYQDMLILARQGTSYIVKATLPVAEEITHLLAAGNAQFSFVLRPDADTTLMIQAVENSRALEAFARDVRQLQENAGLVPGDVTTMRVAGIAALRWDADLGTGHGAIRARTVVFEVVPTAYLAADPTQSSAAGNHMSGSSTSGVQDAVCMAALPS
jgi:hypothetical protein